MPVALTTTTLGTVIVSEFTITLNLPVAEREKLPGRPTARSKVMRTPVITAVMPELLCDADADEPPNARVPLSSVSAMVSRTLPSENPRFAIETEGFCSERGPTVMVLVLFAVDEVEESRVKLVVEASFLAAATPDEATVAKLPALKFTSTSPGPKRAVPLLGLLFTKE
jgi:hypothetical protein